MESYILYRRRNNTDYQQKIFLEYIKDKHLSNVLLMITPAFASWEIIQQLDQEPLLDGFNCYIMDLLMEYYEKQSFSFTKGIEKIPRKIHYCWFGGKQIPHHLRKYMDTWKKKCSEYEIIRWDESNYDITKNPYMREAYECKKWGFVPDYARLDIIFREGGIYLDTGHPLIGQMRDFYNDKSFYHEEGSMNLTPCFSYQNAVLKQFGFQVKNQYQKIHDVVIYPSEVAAPAGIKGMQHNFTKNTIMDRHTELSWASKEERRSMELYKKNILKRKVYRGGGKLKYRIIRTEADAS